MRRTTATLGTLALVGAVGLFLSHDGSEDVLDPPSTRDRVGASAAPVEPALEPAAPAPPPVPRDPLAVEALSEDAMVQRALEGCRAGTDANVLPAWALRALACDDVPWEPDLLACLLARAAADAGHGARLAQALAGLLGRVGAPSLRLGAEPHAEALALLQELVRRRAPEEHTWWESFWGGLGPRDIWLREYLYLAAGREVGVDRLLAFMGQTVTWEPAGMLRLGAAGTALRRLQTRVPRGDVLVPDAASMRIVMLKGIPVTRLGHHQAEPWFGSEAAQRRIRELWDADVEGDEQRRAHGLWRANYLGNIWQYAGHAPAIEDLRAAFPESADPRESFEAEDVIRFASAVRAYLATVDHASPVVRQRADTILVPLRRALDQASSDALTQLVVRLRPHLMDASVKRVVAELLEMRYAALHPRAQALIAR